MTNCGFSVTYSRFKLLTDEEEEAEKKRISDLENENANKNSIGSEIMGIQEISYKLIINQYDVPVGSVLKLILEVIKANRSKRKGMY